MISISHYTEKQERSVHVDYKIFVWGLVFTTCYNKYNCKIRTIKALLQVYIMGIIYEFRTRNPQKYSELFVRSFSVITRLKVLIKIIYNYKKEKKYV